MIAKKCKKCDNPAWSGGLCKNHIIKKPMKSKTSFKATAGYTIVRSGGRQTGKTHSQNRYKLFLVIWKKRGNISEVSGNKIYGEPSSAHFHHILSKSKYPEADLDEENIIILTMDEHNNVENDIYKYEEVNRRRELLLNKYNLI